MSQDARAFNWNSIPIKTASIARPAAGSNYAIVTVPTGKKWLLKCVGFSDTTDANAANRYPYLWCAMDGSNTSCGVMQQLPIIASQTAVYCIFGPGSGTSGVATSGLTVTTGMGDGIEMPAGATFSVYVLNIQATDRPVGPCYYAYKEVPL